MKACLPVDFTLGDTKRVPLMKLRKIQTGQIDVLLQNYEILVNILAMNRWFYCRANLIVSINLAQCLTSIINRNNSELLQDSSQNKNNILANKKISHLKTV